MKKIIALAVAVVAVAIAGSEAQAQFSNGYQFGAGVNSAQHNPGFGFSSFLGRGFASRQARPPYFAQFPPVYYSGIVRRPYGISPYAAPAGVVPVEMSHAIAPAEPVVVKNPFFNKNKTAPVSVVDKGEEDEKATKNKSTKVTNKFFKANQEVVGSIMHASFEDN